MSHVARNTALAGVLVIGLGAAAVLYAANNGSQEYAQSKLYGAADVQALDIGSRDVNLHILPSTDGKVGVNFHGKGPAGYQLVSELQGNRLHVEIEKTSFSFQLFSFSFHNPLELDVTLPEKEYDQLNVQLSSGNADVEHVKAKQSVMQVSSGNLNVQSLSSQTLELTSHSGNVEGADLQADATIKASSGNIHIMNLTGSHQDVTSSSGNIKLEQVQGDVKAHASSGNIVLQMADAKNNLDLSASSGNVHVLLPSDANFQTDVSVASGDVQVGFPVQWTQNDKHHKVGMVGSGGPMVRLNTSSGNVVLSKQ